MKLLKVIERAQNSLWWTYCHFDSHTKSLLSLYNSTLVVLRVYSLVVKVTQTLCRRHMQSFGVTHKHKGTQIILITPKSLWKAHKVIVKTQIITQVTASLWEGCTETFWGLPKSLRVSQSIFVRVTESHVMLIQHYCEYQTKSLLGHPNSLWQDTKSLWGHT